MPCTPERGQAAFDFEDYLAWFSVTPSRITNSVIRAVKNRSEAKIPLALDLSAIGYYSGKVVRNMTTYSIVESMHYQVDPGPSYVRDNDVTVEAFIDPSEDFARNLFVNRDNIQGMVINLSNLCISLKGNPRTNSITFNDKIMQGVDLQKQDLAFVITDDEPSITWQTTPVNVMPRREIMITTVQRPYDLQF